MRKFFYTLGAFAAIAAAFVSCERQEMPNPNDNLVTITLRAEKAGVDTKTGAVPNGGLVSYLWTDEDKTNMKLFIVGEDEEGNEKLTVIKDREIAISSDNKTLTITATVDANSTLRAALASAWTGSNNPKVNVNQRPVSDNFDPNADVLVSDDVTVDELDEALLTFRRPVTVSKMTLKNLVKGEKVREITISSDKLLVGYCEGQTIKGQPGGNFITLSYDNVEVGEDEPFPVYFVTMPNEGQTLTVVVKTDQNSYTKTFGTLDFTVGKFAKFGVGLPKGTPVVDTDYTGDWVITGLNDDSAFAAQAFVSGNNNLSALGVKLDVANEKILSTKVNEIKMHLAKVTEGDYAGFYTIKDASGNYLYAASSSANYLKGKATIDGANYYWAVEKESDGTFSIKATKSSNRNVMQFNSSNSVFSCYASASQKPVTLYPYSWVVEDTNAPQPSGTGTLDDPYNALGAVDAVKDLTWTSNTDYESTDDVYVKGKISRIADKGTFTEGGTYGNASFYVSEDGNAVNEFYCFRVLYLGNQKFEAGHTDIKVGDEVVIYGKLMNYKGNTPETVGNEAYLYSLNGLTEDEPAGTTTATIKFGTYDVKINAASVTGDDDRGNTWTITTKGTTSFTANAEYYQVGSSSKPASSITFTTTLPETVTKVDNLSIKLGGFSGTAGDVTLKVGDATVVGTGNLNATNDVTVSSTSSADGRTITITVSNISKGVKVYNITAEYE